MLRRQGRLDNLKATIDEALAIADAAGQDEVRRLLVLSMEALMRGETRRSSELRVAGAQAADHNSSP